VPHSKRPRTPLPFPPPGPGQGDAPARKVSHRRRIGIYLTPSDRISPCVSRPMVPARYYTHPTAPRAPALPLRGLCPPRGSFPPAALRFFGPRRHCPPPPHHTTTIGGRPSAGAPVCRRSAVRPPPCPESFAPLLHGRRPGPSPRSGGRRMPHPKSDGRTERRSAADRFLFYSPCPPPISRPAALPAPHPFPPSPLCVPPLHRVVFPRVLMPVSPPTPPLSTPSLVPPLR